MLALEALAEFALAEPNRFIYQMQVTSENTFSAGWEVTHNLNASTFSILYEDEVCNDTNITYNLILSITWKSTIFSSVQSHMGHVRMSALETSEDINGSYHRKQKKHTISITFCHFLLVSSGNT